ncbi:hypothetical protein [Candidatus Blastococcus massiliensis]|uniref:hypothetical protein n=1 Tax=Candidatus Blastococcus massiliensis TaxID=1470358 RepID=UPI0004B44AC9|nr:hypothetical protein [Candidatus Blastococcus massiliensis]
MSRPRDWHPLADRDPVPGDADELARLAQRYRDTADAIRNARDSLDRLSGHEGWNSDAGRSFRREADGTADEVGQAHVRYQRAADGLAAYVRELRGVQDDADSLLRQARRADDDLRVARGRERTAEAAAPDSAEALSLGARRSEVAALEAEIARLATRLRETVVPRWRAAGDRTAAALERIAEIDGLKDSRWDDFVGAMKTLGGWAGRLSAILGVLALACMVVPGLQPFAALFGALAFATGAVALAGSGLAHYENRGSLSDVLWNAVGVLTFGTGRAFTSVARGLGRAAASAAKPAYVTSLRAAGSTRRQARATARQVDWTGTRRIPHGRALRARAAEPVPWVPRPREVAASLSPRGVVGEVVADLRAASAVRAGGQLPSTAPDAVLDVVRGLPAPVRATPEVGAAMRNATIAGRISTGGVAVSTYAGGRELDLPLPPVEAPPVPGSAR